MKGRASVFRGKENGVRVVGIITKDGAAAFERQREQLSKLFRRVCGYAPASFSDADVIEFLARGEKGTREYLIEHRED